MPASKISELCQYSAESRGMDPHTIYTIGHSTHAIEYFLALLHHYNINCLVDVRSIAMSRYNPQYNKESLSPFLESHGIQYLHFAEEFGARRSEPGVLSDTGRVDFAKVSRTDTFQNGIARLSRGMEKNYRIVLMCAESEPTACHRFSMIARALVREGKLVSHILKDRTIKTNATLEAELIARYDKRIGQDMFQMPLAENEKLEAAYRLLNNEIGFMASAKKKS